MELTRRVSCSISAACLFWHNSASCSLLSAPASTASIASSYPQWQNTTTQIERITLSIWRMIIVTLHTRTEEVQRFKRNYQEKFIARENYEMTSFQHCWVHRTYKTLKPNTHDESCNGKSSETFLYGNRGPEKALPKSHESKEQRDCSCSSTATTVIPRL
jgi:hypothetical protein